MKSILKLISRPLPAGSLCELRYEFRVKRKKEKEKEERIVRRILRALPERSGEETTQGVNVCRSKKKAADNVRRGGALLSRTGIYKSQVGLKFKLVRIRSEAIGNLRKQEMRVSLSMIRYCGTVAIVILFDYLHMSNGAIFLFF